MKIALLGYGKMGKLLEELSIKNGHQVLAKFSQQLGPLSRRQLELQSVDVCIDFSHFSCVKEHVKICAELRKPLVIGTTGWDVHLDEVKDIVNCSQIGCLYAPNFAIGVNLFMQIVAYAAHLMDPFVEYDVVGIEHHHRQKVDQPSGTAKAIIQRVLQNMNRLEDLPFTSVRCGYETGIHTIQFNGPVDKITLCHESRTREGFAHGAIKADDWLKN